MNYPLHFLLAAIISTSATRSQEGSPRLSLETGIFAGGMNCLTDLGGTKRSFLFVADDFRLSDTRPAIGIYGVLAYKNRLALHLAINTGSVRAADRSARNNDQDPGSRYIRNLSFSSGIRELRLGFEIRVLNKWWYGEDEIHRLTLGLSGGTALYHFNPEAWMDGVKYPLRDYRLEGQGFPELNGTAVYKRTQLSLPVGFIINRSLAGRFSLAVEFIYHFLFTDYLDDVSRQYINPELFSRHLDPEKARIARLLQHRTPELVAAPFPLYQPRGNPEKNDAWFSFGLKAGVTL